MNDTKTLLKVKNLNKVFKNKNVIVKAIDNASFEVKKGEILGLIGESGSGKTTIGRTVIGLHEATSGLIELEGRDITNSSSKKVRKEIVRDIQMVFQDPYSSLNGQKNVMSIVAEPIVASKIWKNDLKQVLSNRKDILKFYKYTLIELYWKEFSKYRIYANKKASDFMIKLKKDLDDFIINNKESKEDNFNALVNIYYRNRTTINMEILEELVKKEQLFTNKWSEFDYNITKMKNIPRDEKSLIKAQENINKIKTDIKYSEKAQTILKQIKKFQKEYKDLSNIPKNKQKYIYFSYKKIINIIKNDIKVHYTEKQLSQSKSTYEFENKKLKVAKKKKEFVNKLWDDLKKVLIFNIDEISDFLANHFKTESEREKFRKILIQKNEIAYAKFKEQKKLLAKKISILKENLKKVISLDRNIEIEKLKNKLSEAEVKLASAKKVFAMETKNFLVKFNKDNIEIKEKAKIIINEHLSNYKILKVSTSMIFNKFIHQLEKDFPKDNFNYKKMKDIISKEETKNQALEIELKSIHKNIKILSYLYNVNKKSKLFLRSLLKKLIIRNKVYDALKHSGLKTSYAYRYPHEFSGGMRQRVGIARAIINKPKLIIADEPIAALDLSIQAQVVNMLLDQKDRLGLAMIFIAHDLSMVRFNSDRILIMHLGKIVEYGETEKIFQKPIHPYTKNLIKSMPSIANAKKGIETTEFKPLYLDDYTATNIPAYQKLNGDHFVLATKKQLSKWKKLK